MYRSWAGVGGGGVTNRDQPWLLTPNRQGSTLGHSRGPCYPPDRIYLQDDWQAGGRPWVPRIPEDNGHVLSSRASAPERLAPGPSQGPVCISCLVTRASERLRSHCTGLESSHLSGGSGPSTHFCASPRADRGWGEKSWEVALGCLSTAAASGAPSLWATLLSQECSPPSGSPGHRGRCRRTGLTGVGSSYRLRSRAVPVCPRPWWHPWVGSEGWRLCPQSDSPVKCPSRHLLLGHHWRSLPVRPGPSPLRGCVLGFGSSVPGGHPSSSGGLGDVLLCWAQGWAHGGRKRNSVLKCSSFTWDPHTTLQPPQEPSGSKIFRSRSFNFYSINFLAHFPDLALFSFSPSLVTDRVKRQKRKGRKSR